MELVPERDLILEINTMPMLTAFRKELGRLGLNRGDVDPSKDRIK